MAASSSKGSKGGNDVIEWMGLKLTKDDMKVCKDCKKKGPTSMVEKATSAGHLVCLNLAIHNPPSRRPIDPRRDKYELERALFLAVENNRPKCIKLIMETWGDTCRTNCDGKTPVYVAAEKGYIDCLKVLCDDDTIDILFSDYDEDGDIVAIARTNGHDECVKFLKAKGANDPLEADDEEEEEEEEGDDEVVDDNNVTMCEEEEENNEDGPGAQGDGEPEMKKAKNE